MMAADSLHFAAPLIVPSGMSFYCSSPCRRACSAGAFAPHFALGRRCPERERGAKAEGKTKGFGTLPPAKPVCTWGWRGTARLRRRAAWGARHAPMQACPRASHARTRRSLQGAQP
ncbi:hypothetical protein APB74_33340 [Pseudomonas aeruginosa]|nr:hypothetical protein APB74_33340 [Pseudomonas aeruginosa]